MLKINIEVSSGMAKIKTHFSMITPGERRAWEISFATSKPDVLSNPQKIIHHLYTGITWPRTVPNSEAGRAFHGT